MPQSGYGSFDVNKQPPEAGEEDPFEAPEENRRACSKGSPVDAGEDQVVASWSASLVWWYSRLVFGNICYLFAIVQARPLTLQDLQRVDQAIHHGNGCVDCVNFRQLRYDANQRSLLGAIWQLEYKSFLSSGVLLLLSVPCSLGPIVVLYVMLTSLVWQQNDPMQVVWCLAALFVSSHVGTLLRCHGELILLRSSRRIAACCQSLVLQRTLENPLAQKSSIAEVTSVNAGVEALAHWIRQANGGWLSLLELAGQICLVNLAMKAKLVAVITGLLSFIAFVMLVSSLESWLKQESAKRSTFRWKAINECFRGVQSVKLNAWEERFEKKILEAREFEEKSVFRMQCAVVFRMAVSWWSDELLVAAAFLMLVLQDHVIDPAFAFSIIMLAQQMKITISQAIRSLPALRSGLHAARVIEYYLHTVAVHHEQANPVIQINSGKHPPTTVIATNRACFSYALNGFGHCLMSVSIRVFRGELVVVHGKAGEGKTTLLTALLGEVLCIHGELFVSGECRVAYCSQDPWVQSLTVRDNILFGSLYDEKKYFAVLHACCLIEDLSELPDGDCTIIGPRGINLSGGQRARIALARACYADADLYVLDCPLASVDAVVQMDVFRKCIVELLRYKTVLLATHNAEFIHSPMVDRLLEVGGKTVNGCDANPDSITLATQRVKEYESSYWGTQRESDENLSSRSRSLVLEELSSRMISRMKNLQNRATTSKDDRSPLIESVESIGCLRTIQQYISMSTEAQLLIASGFVAIIAKEVILVTKNFWLAWWSSSGGTHYEVAFRNGVVYVALVLIAFCGLMVSMFLISMATSVASDRVFRKMLHAILHVKMPFFYWTPTGEVLNRFFMDIHVIDHEMMWPISVFLVSSLSILSTCLVLWYLLGWIGFALPLVVLICIVKTQVFDLLVSIKLLDSKNDSTELSMISEALEGMSVIRAFGAASVDRFVVDRARCILNENQLTIVNGTVRCYEMLFLSWLQGLIMVALAILLAMDSAETSRTPSELGLAMIYLLNLPFHATQFLASWFKAAISLISVNRLLTYCSVLPEENKDSIALTSHDSTLHNRWMPHGAIAFDKVWFRYSEAGDTATYALKNMSFSIEGSAKIGVVGRTGSGKSSIAMALFRVHELVRGRILVDGTDIISLPLRLLRSKMSIIVQTPMFYRCTVREYLDPFDEFSDNDLWQVTHKVGLSSFVQSLQTELQENGENWSLGQRQLLCLARSLLRPSKIVILDEPFSSIDGESDKQLLSVLSSELRESTVLFVTHRLDQVLTFCEKILVLKDGEVEDFGVVEELVGRSDGVFFELLENTLLTR